MTHAGSVFLGAWSPEPMGDYCSGTNHVLPTEGYARALSGLSLIDFTKRITVQELTADGLRNLGPVAQDTRATGGPGCARQRGHAFGSRRLEAGRAMSRVLDLARPDLSVCSRTSHAAWEPALERLHANELPWRAWATTRDAVSTVIPSRSRASWSQRLARLYGVPSSES